MPPHKTAANEHLSNFLRRRQFELGLTLAEIAERMRAHGFHTSDESVRRYLRTGAIPIGVLAEHGNAIAAAFEVSLDSIITVRDEDLGPVSMLPDLVAERIFGVFTPAQEQRIRAIFKEMRD